MPTVSVYFTAAEYDTIYAAAKEKTLSVTDYIKIATLKTISEKRV